MNDDEWVEVTWGKELYSPVKYNTFEVGPFVRRTKVRKGETPELAFARVYDELEKLAKASFLRKSGAFIKSLTSVGRQAAEAKHQE